MDDPGTGPREYAGAPDLRHGHGRAAAAGKPGHLDRVARADLHLPVGALRQHRQQLQPDPRRHHRVLSGRERRRRLDAGRRRHRNEQRRQRPGDVDGHHSGPTDRQPPANTQAPQITGTVAVGQQLQASPGSWTGSPTPTFAYQWQRCDSTGNNCNPIQGATNATYTITTSDIGSTLNLVVTGTNSAGSAQAASAATAVVPPPSSGFPPAAPPTTPVLDTFNRANGSVGSNWTVMHAGSFSTMNIANNVAVNPGSASQYAWNYWNPATFGPDVEAYATVATYSGNDTLRIGARVSVNSSTYSGYFVSIAANGLWSILRITTATVTTLASGVTDPISSGDQIGIRIVGSVITALHKTAPTAGSRC